MEKQTQNRAGRLRAGLLSLLAVAALAGLDQLIKAWAVAVLQPRGSMPFLPGVVELQFVLNDGMAFSMLSGRRGLLLGATGLILAALLLILLLRRMALVERAVWVLVAGGGIGNFIDRARTGAVVDYLNFQFMQFPVFNFADICVTVGVALLILLLLLDLRRESAAPPADAPKPSHGDS